MQPILASLLSEVPVSEPPAAHACSFEQVGRRSKVSAPDVRPMTTQQHSVRRQNTDGDLTMRVSQDMANGWGRQSTAISMLPRTPKSAPTHMLMAAATFTSLRRPAMPLQSHAREKSNHAAHFGAHGFFSDRCLHVCQPFKHWFRSGAEPQHHSEADENVCSMISCCSLRQGVPGIGAAPRGSAAIYAEAAIPAAPSRGGSCWRRLHSTEKPGPESLQPV